MKKNLLLSFLILFVLSTALIAGVNDPKKDPDKTSAKNTKENKLTDEELSRMNKRVDGKYNTPGSPNFNVDKNSLKKNPNATQVYVEDTGRHGHYGWYGGGLALVLIIILIVVLV